MHVAEQVGEVGREFAVQMSLPSPGDGERQHDPGRLEAAGGQEAYSPSLIHI